MAELLRRYGGAARVIEPDAGGERTTAGSEPRPMLVCLALSFLALAIFAIRLTGYPDLVDNEYRLGATVLNVVQGGNWVLPHDSLGNTDKPPMLTWLSALVSLTVGHVNLFTLYLPTALATLILSLLVFAAGRRYFGWQAGLFGALAYLTSNVIAQQIATARWDGLFALTVALVALAAFRAWAQGGGWTPFWLAAAASTLTKGPLGIVLGSLGLLAVPWERRSGRRQPLRGSHVTGVILFLLIVGGWFAAAYYRAGSHLVDNMVRSELVRHAVMHPPGHRFRKPLSDFMANFAPWSVLTLIGLWHICAHPSRDDGARRFERFCFWWFVGGVLIFAVSPHNPARLLYPLIPPAALIAGRQMAVISGAVGTRRLAAACAVVTLVALTIFVFKRHHWDRRRGHIQQTAAILQLHEIVHERVGDEFPLTYLVDVPFALQLTFHTMRPTVTFAEAATLLRDDAPAYVVVHDVARLRRELQGDVPALYEVATSSVGRTPYLHIVSNRPQLTWADPVQIGLGPLRLRLDGLRLGATQDGEITLEGRADGVQAVLVNGSTEPASVAVRLIGGARPARETRQLAAGEAWRVVAE